YPIHTSSVAHSYKFLYRDLPNPGLNVVGMENCGIIANRNLDEWKINREFFIRIAMSKKFLKMLTGKTYKTTADMFKLWDIMINDKKEVDLFRWLEKLTGDIAISTSTGPSAYSMLTYFNSLGYEYDLNYIPASELEQSSKLISLINSFFKAMQWFSLIPPFIRNAPGIKYFNNKIFNNVKNLKVFLLEVIQRRRTEIDLLSNNSLLPSDFLTLLLTVNTPWDLEHTLYKSLSRSLNDHEIFGVIRDIFLALSEIKDIFRDSISLNSLYEGIEKLLYCESLIKEALRLNPPFPLSPRSNSESVEVGGYQWKEGQAFLLFCQKININKSDWIDGEIFAPERFLKNMNSKRSMNAKEAN
ncbi:8526_t:CDS:2, partial [Racocetra fulgida]